MFLQHFIILRILSPCFFVAFSRLTGNHTLQVIFSLCFFSDGPFTNSFWGVWLECYLLSSFSHILCWQCQLPHRKGELLVRTARDIARWGQIAGKRINNLSSSSRTTHYGEVFFCSQLISHIAKLLSVILQVDSSWVA